MTLVQICNIALSYKITVVDFALFFIITLDFEASHGIRDFVLILSFTPFPMYVIEIWATPLSMGG